MYLEDIQTYVVGRNSVTIQGAMNSAVVAPNGGFVIIPANYFGTDTYTDVTGVTVIDLRSAGQNPSWAGGQTALIGRGTSLGVSANTAATNIVTVTPVAGIYRVSVYIVNTSAFLTAGASVSIGYTDAQQAQTLVTPATAIGAGAVVTASLIVQTSGTAPITYAVNSSGTWGTANVYVVLERLA